MEPQEAKNSLKAVETAPVLSRRPSVVEVAMGALSVTLVLVGGAGVIIAEPARVVGFLAAGVLLVVVLVCVTRRSPGESVWQPIDHVARWAALIATTLPMHRLIWPADDNVAMGAWIVSSIAALALGGFLALRWRR